MFNPPYACASLTYLNREDQSEKKYVWNYPITRVELIDARGTKLRFFEATDDGKWEEVDD